MEIVIRSICGMLLEDLYPDLSSEELKELTPEIIRNGVMYFLAENPDILTDEYNVEIELIDD